MWRMGTATTQAAVRDALGRSSLSGRPSRPMRSSELHKNADFILLRLTNLILQCQTTGMAADIPCASAIRSAQVRQEGLTANLEVDSCQAGGLLSLAASPAVIFTTTSHRQALCRLRSASLKLASHGDLAFGQTSS